MLILLAFKRPGGRPPTSDDIRLIAYLTFAP